MSDPQHASPQPTDALTEMRVSAARLAEDLSRSRASLAVADRLAESSRAPGLAALDAALEAVRPLQDPPFQPTAP